MAAWKPDCGTGVLLLGREESDKLGRNIIVEVPSSFTSPNTI